MNKLENDINELTCQNKIKDIHVQEDDIFSSEDNNFILLKTKNLIIFLVLLIALNASLAVILFLK